jgi:hypothetical protein
MNYFRWLIASALLVNASSGWCAQTSKPALLNNGGFEIIDEANLQHPAIWSIDGIGPVYTLDASVHKKGRYSLRIGFKEGANTEGYSGMIQKISAAPFAGKRIVISAYLRRSSEKSIVGIWALLNAANNKRLEYINSYEQPILNGSKWSIHQLEIEVPAEATSLALGAAIYENNGEMWVDEMSIREVKNHRQ